VYVNILKYPTFQTFFFELLKVLAQENLKAGSLIEKNIHKEKKPN
jgi:hypothetical protein